MSHTYVEPGSVDETVTLLAEIGPQAGLVAGGTDVVVAARSGKEPLPPALVAIHRLVELQDISDATTNGGGLRLGALVSYAELERSQSVLNSYTALAEAATLVGSPATRYLGTIGGNLCNGSPAMETGSPLLVYGASIELRSAAGERTVPIEEFLLGPGKTTRADGEILTP